MRHLSRLLLAAATTTLLAVTSAPAGASWDRPIKRGTDTFTIPAKATITLTGHGYGHGRGMSQYGAQGAAMEGLSSQQIVSFYYPGTSLARFLDDFACCSPVTRPMTSSYAVANVSSCGRSARRRSRCRLVLLDSGSSRGE